MATPSTTSSSKQPSGPGSASGSRAGTGNAASTKTTKDFINHLKQQAKSPQFYWFLSHISALWFMLLNTLVSTFKGVDSPRAISYYNFSALSIIITYSIVIRQTYKSKPITFLFSQLPSLLKDDNVQYLLLAIVYRLFSSRFYGGISSFTLYPFDNIKFQVLLLNLSRITMKDHCLSLLISKF
ncbi:unnamed protein product [Ambrosiozyma monospora]|uniref:Unnamed protein product n=1 Tax=Ambrosiozyma monospora TaxID=43982 RepID=A0A9W6Z9K2_AMBMO|nr:unnamed protein product [Ambrosiozyma monospora]